MIRIVSNSLGSGDWVKVDVVGDFDSPGPIFEGHRITPTDLQFILETAQQYGPQEIELVNVSDEEMESV